MAGRLQYTAVVRFALAASMAAVPVKATAEPATLEQRLDKLCAELDSQRQAHHVPGFALAIVHEDKVILCRGFGDRDVEQHLPVTKETLFAIGSTTKAFTATLIGTLIDQGKMSWDDRTAKHLPGFAFKDPLANQQATVRDLLCHRTGLMGTDLLWYGGTAGRDEILQAVAAAEPTKSFREAFQYQNVMYLAAGEAAGQAAGSDWDTLIAERFFKPLGMAASTTRYAEAQRNPELAKGYHWDKDGSAFKHDPMRVLDNIGPAGSINSTATDMAQWVRLLLGRGSIDGKRIVSSERLEETWTPQIDAFGAKYGLGWLVHDWKGRRLIEHTGGIDGFGAKVALLPDVGVGFVLLANSMHAAVLETSVGPVFDAVLGLEEPATAAMDSAQLQKYLGRFLLEAPGMKITVTALIQDGKLAVDVPGQTVYALKPPDEDGKWFFELTDTIAVSFDGDHEPVNAMTLHQGGFTLECPREGYTPPIEMSLDEARDYLATYHSDELPVDFTVVHNNGRLAVDVPGEMAWSLHRPNDQGRWLFRAKREWAVEFERDATGAIVAMPFHRDGTTYRMNRVDAKGVADAEALPDMQELLALHSRGHGTEAIVALGDVRLVSSISFINQGLNGRSTISASGLDRWSEQIDLGPFGWIHMGTTGQAGWSASSFHEPQTLTAEQARQMRIQHPLMPAADWSAVFDSVRIARIDERDGKQFIVTELKSGADVAALAFVDADSGLVDRIEFSKVIPGAGQTQSTLRFSDYRDVSGVKLPYRWELDDSTMGRLVMVIESIETGLALSPDTFEPAPTKQP